MSPAVIEYPVTSQQINLPHLKEWNGRCWQVHQGEPGFSCSLLPRREMNRGGSMHCVAGGLTFSTTAHTHSSTHTVATADGEACSLLPRSRVLTCSPREVKLHHPGQRETIIIQLWSQRLLRQRKKSGQGSPAGGEVGFFAACPAQGFTWTSISIKGGGGAAPVPHPLIFCCNPDYKGCAQGKPPPSPCCFRVSRGWNFNCAFCIPFLLRVFKILSEIFCFVWIPKRKSFRHACLWGALLSHTSLSIFWYTEVMTKKEM